MVALDSNMTDYASVRAHDDDDLDATPANNGAGQTAAVHQLFTRIAKEIEEKKPQNCIHFVVDFLCKHYPEHLHGFASIWNSDPELERERQEVVSFFRSHKISTQVSAHFTNAGYDTLETLATLTADSLVDIEAFNSVKWLPGHKVRLQQVFSDIGARVREYKQRQPTPAVAPSFGGVGGASAVSPALLAAQAEQQRLQQQYIQMMVQQQQLDQQRRELVAAQSNANNTPMSHVKSPVDGGTTTTTLPVGTTTTTTLPGTVYTSTGIPGATDLRQGFQLQGLQMPRIISAGATASTTKTYTVTAPQTTSTD